MRDLTWFGVIMTVVIVAVVAGVGFMIYYNVDSYRNECHRAGGHIVSVRNEEICVDRDNRVIFL